MDIFIEQIVKKKIGSKDIFIYIAVLLGIGIILSLIAAMIPMLLLPVLVGLIAAAYFIFTSRSIEYEYSVTQKKKCSFRGCARYRILCEIQCEGPACKILFTAHRCVG